MPLEQENPELKNIERVVELERTIEREPEETNEIADEAVRKDYESVKAENLALEKPDVLKPEVLLSELEGKSIKELEGTLADKLKETKIADTETDPLISATIKEIADKLTDKDYKDENIASKISDLAYNASNGDVGTYAWLMEKLESHVSEILKNQPKM